MGDLNMRLEDMIASLTSQNGGGGILSRGREDRCYDEISGKDFRARASFWDSYIKNHGESHSISEYRSEEERQLSLDVKIDFPEGIGGETLDELDSLSREICFEVQEMIGDWFKEEGGGDPKASCLYMRGKRDDGAFVDKTFSGRIFFPYCRLGKEGSERVIEEIKKRARFKYIGNSYVTMPCTDIHESISLSPNPLPLYGSKERGGKPPLEIQTNIGGVAPDKSRFRFPIAEEGMAMVISKNYAEDRGILVSRGPIREEGEDIIPNDIGEWEANEEIVKCDKFLPLLSPERAKCYHDWLDVGASLWSIGDEGLERWKEFTKKGEGIFNDDDCDREWLDMEGNTFNTSSTIQYFARRDDNIGYKRLMKEDVDVLIKLAIENQTSGATANVFKILYPYQFLCSNFDANTWYYYCGTKWCGNGKAKLYSVFKNSFIPHLGRYRSRMMEEYNNIPDAEERKEMNSMVKKVTSLIQKLEGMTFKRSVVDSLRIEYLNDDFECIRDTIPHATAFANTIIDVRSGRAVPREGKPEDYITKCSRIPYKRDAECIAKTRKYMNEVFRDKSKRDFMYRLVSSMLFARNKDKIVASLCGVGNNSKSAFIKVLQRAFGTYSGKIGTSILTEKRTGSDGATPGLIRISGCRTAIAEEPDKRDPVRSGTIKELSGGDSYPVRELFQRGSDTMEKIPTFIFMIVSNHKLLAYDTQQAFWNRVCHIEFESEWVKEGYPETYEEQLEEGKFPIDPDFDKSVGNIAKGMVWLACEAYAEYSERGLMIPECVKEDSENLRKMNNFYLSFVKDCICKEEGRELNAREAFNAFKEWFIEQSYSIPRPDFQEFIENASLILGKKLTSGGCWRGWKFSDEDSLINDILRMD